MQITTTPTPNPSPQGGGEPRRMRGAGVREPTDRILVPARSTNLRIELADQAVPSRDAFGERAPETLVAAPLEIVDADALLLDPGVIAEVEDALAIDVSELEHMVVDDALEVTREDFAGARLVETIRIMPGEIGLPLAGVEGCAVGRHRHHDVVGAEIEVLDELDRRQI